MYNTFTQKLKEAYALANFDEIRQQCSKYCLEKAQNIFTSFTTKRKPDGKAKGAFNYRDFVC